MLDISSPKNFLIVGYGVSGKSAYNFLKKKSHNVSVFEDSEREPYVPDRVTMVDWGKIDLVVKSPAVPFMPHNCHKIISQAADHNIPVISTFDLFRLYNPNAKIVCITGTNGKSTTTALIYHILKKSGFSVQLGGNIGVPYFDLGESEWYVFEMSSYELASSRFLDFEISCLLNIEPDHMEIHGGFNSYVQAKHRALNHAKLRVISYEDPITMEKYFKAKNIVTVSLKCSTDADVHVCENALLDNNSKQLILDLSALSNLRGDHNHQNVAFAYTVCNKLGVPSREILKNILSFEPLPHRMNTVRKIGNVLFVNDSKATNPCSAAKALATFVGYKIYWLVGGRSKNVDPMPYVKDHLAEIQKIYLFGESMDEFEGVFGRIKQTARCKTMENAINVSFKEAAEETGPAVILLSPMCASFDQFANFEERGNEFVRLVLDLRK